MSRDLLSVSVLSSLVLFSILLIKVYGAGHFNVNIVATLASSSPASVVLGTISIYSYFFLAVIGVAAAWLALASFFKRWGLKPYRTLFAGTAIFLFLLSPLRYFVDAVVLSLILVLLQLSAYVLWNKWLRRQSEDAIKRLLSAVTRGRFRKKAPWPRFGDWEEFSLPRASLTSLAVIFALFLLLTLDQPWAPSVVVTLKHPISTNQTRPIASLSRKPVAFELADDNGTMQVLIDDARTILYIPDSDIESKQLCNLNSNFMGSNPAFELSQNFQGNVESCWRLTDQCDEQKIQGPPRIISWLEAAPKATPWRTGAELPPHSKKKLGPGADGRCGPPIDPNQP